MVNITPIAPIDYERYAVLLRPDSELVVTGSQVRPSPREIETANPVNPTRGRRQGFSMDEKKGRPNSIPTGRRGPAQAPALRSSLGGLNPADLSWLIETANNVRNPANVMGGPSSRAVAELYLRDKG